MSATSPRGMPGKSFVADRSRFPRLVVRSRPRKKTPQLTGKIAGDRQELGNPDQWLLNAALQAIQQLEVPGNQLRTGFPLSRKTKQAAVPGNFAEPAGEIVRAEHKVCRRTEPEICRLPLVDVVDRGIAASDASLELFHRLAEALRRQIQIDAPLAIPRTFQVIEPSTSLTDQFAISRSPSPRLSTEKIGVRSWATSSG